MKIINQEQFELAVRERISNETLDQIKSDPGNKQLFDYYFDGCSIKETIEDIKKKFNITENFYNGFQESELKKKFDEIKNEDNWKKPFVYIAGDDLDICIVAINYYLADSPGIDALGNGRFKIECNGYQSN